MTRLRRLAARRSVRDGERVFIAEGAKVVTAALDSGSAVEAVYVDSGAELGDTEQQLLGAAREKGVRVVMLAPGVMDRVADAATPQPVLATVGFVDRPHGEVTSGVVLVLVDVRDPGNIGAILRSADAAAASAVVLCDGCGDLYNPKTVRASAGSLFHVPTARGGDPTTMISTLASRGFHTVATVAHGGVDYAQASLEVPVAIIFGNEARGLDEAIVDRCSSAVTIPISGGAESLNVAMAATVIVFDLARRRRSIDEMRLA